MITYDKGASWNLIPGTDTGCTNPANCSLNLHLKVVDLNADVEPVVSARHAPGIVLATGSVGEHLELAPADNSVFLTLDGGGTWAMVLQGPHLYAFANRGSIICAYDRQENVLKWSMDYGHSFMSAAAALTSVHSLATPPHVRSAKLTVIGEINGATAVADMNFASVIDRTCDASDYFEWRPHGAAEGAGTCWLGARVSFTRRRLTSICIEVWTDGIRPEDPVTSSPCACTPEDYDCDRGYLREGDYCVSLDAATSELPTGDPGDPGSGEGDGGDGHGGDGPHYGETGPPDDCLPGTVLVYMRFRAGCCIHVGVLSLVGCWLLELGVLSRSHVELHCRLPQDPRRHLRWVCVR